jgi:hypothetical protein
VEKTSLLDHPFSLVEAIARQEHFHQPEQMPRGLGFQLPGAIEAAQCRLWFSSVG